MKVVLNARLAMNWRMESVRKMMREGLLGYNFPLTLIMRLSKINN